MLGAYVGGGTEEQIESLGRYFESVGVAFQIIDDVLNLRGFEHDTKDRGEDLKEGKVTFPVAIAMQPSRLTAEARKQMWEQLKSKSSDMVVIDNIIHTIESCGAITDSVNHAKKIIDNGWQQMENIIPDSFHKMILRAFGMYVLKRHY